MPVDTTQHTFYSPAFAQTIRDALAFLGASPLHALPPDAFAGTGVYALYYHGAYAHYAGVRQNRQNTSLPIYVGKAVPQGWRRARGKVSGRSSELSNRLREHAGSIAQTSNLDIADFSCRFMILSGDEADLISTVEAALIRTYQPLWNSLIDGFGNHDPGSGRYAQKPSEWDTLHPGRSWASRLTGQAPTIASIIAKLK